VCVCVCIFTIITYAVIIIVAFFENVQDGHLSGKCCRFDMAHFSRDMSSEKSPTPRG